MKRMTGLTTIVVLGLLLVCDCLAAEQLMPISKPLVATSGANSHVRKPSFMRVTKSEDWIRIWAAHLGTTKDDAYRSLFEVDFDRLLVIVIFRGETANVRGIQIDSLSETPDSVVVRFTELGYQTAGIDNNKPWDRPYAFVISSKTNKIIVVEENIQTVKGDPPVWKERAQLKEGQTVVQPTVKS